MTDITKGEWKITDLNRLDELESKRLHWFVIVENKELGEGTIIADVGTNKSNAQLIASAPELYEALKTIVLNYAEVGEIGLRIDGVMDNAWRAIAKVENK